MKFNIDMNGVCEDGKVIFDGKLDLGEEQGVYTWNGTATPTEFSACTKGRAGERACFKWCAQSGCDERTVEDSNRGA